MTDRRTGVDAMKRLMVLSFGALLLAGCYSDRWVQEPLLEQRNETISLEHRLEDDKIVDMGFAHPYSMDHREMAMILKGLVYQEPRLFRDPETVPVFFSDDADRLARGLVKALGQADTRQRVRFKSLNQGGGLLFSAERTTDGVLFLEAGRKLNIAFERINDEPDVDDMSYTPPAHTPRDPCKITASRTPLRTKPWYIPRSSKETGRLYPMWIVVDLNKARDIFRMQDVGSEEEVPPAATDEPEDGSGKEGAVPVPVKPGEDGSTRTETVPKEPARTEKTAKPEELPDPVMEKLKRLKEYFDEGLIDEEEYKAQKKKILEELK